MTLTEGRPIIKPKKKDIAQKLSGNREMNTVTRGRTATCYFMKSDSLPCFQKYLKHHKKNPIDEKYYTSL